MTLVHPVWCMRLRASSRWGCRATLARGSASSTPMAAPTRSRPLGAGDAGRAAADHRGYPGLPYGLRDFPGRAMVLVDLGFRHDLSHAGHAVGDNVQHSDGLCRGRDCGFGDVARSVLDDVGALGGIISVAAGLDFTGRRWPSQF